MGLIFLFFIFKLRMGLGIVLSSSVLPQLYKINFKN